MTPLQAAQGLKELISPGRQRNVFIIAARNAILNDPISFIDKVKKLNLDYTAETYSFLSVLRGLKPADIKLAEADLAAILNNQDLTDPDTLSKDQIAALAKYGVDPANLNISTVAANPKQNHTGKISAEVGVFISDVRRKLQKEAAATAATAIASVATATPTMNVNATATATATATPIGTALAIEDGLDRKTPAESAYIAAGSGFAAATPYSSLNSALNSDGIDRKFNAEEAARKAFGMNAFHRTYDTTSAAITAKAGTAAASVAVDPAIENRALQTRLNSAMEEIARLTKLNEALLKPRPKTVQTAAADLKHSNSNLAALDQVNQLVSVLNDANQTIASQRLIIAQQTADVTRLELEHQNSIVAFRAHADDLNGRVVSSEGTVRQVRIQNQQLAASMSGIVAAHQEAEIRARDNLQLYLDLQARFK